MSISGWDGILSSLMKKQTKTKLLKTTEQEKHILDPELQQLNVTLLSAIARLDGFSPRG